MDKKERIYSSDTGREESNNQSLCSVSTVCMYGLRAHRPRGATTVIE